MRSVAAERTPNHRKFAKTINEFALSLRYLYPKHMQRLLTKTTLIVLILASNVLIAQEESGMRRRVIDPGTDSLLLDTLLVLPSTIRAGARKANEGFTFNAATGVLKLTPPPNDTLVIEYTTIALRRLTTLANKDTLMIRTGEVAGYSPYIIGRDLFPDTRFEQGELVKAGSISRGVAFGNSQDLAVNSNLNLQLSGKITDRYRVLASVTDDNIPIQPDGNTRQLQDFDQVYIKVYDDNTTLTAGDFQITHNETYFMQYVKRARGGTVETVWGDSLNRFGATASAAISKGKFARNVINGVEGNQGPYRLIGAENERFIIIMAGTERVFIDGRLLERGQEYDYVIDYNTAELVFTPKNLITKDRRIVVEFQYSDRNYARALLQGGATGQQGKIDWFVHAVSEQDSKNQPLQQELTAEDRFFLSTVGNDINNAVQPSLDSVAFSDSRVLYALVDSLGYDSVLVYSNDPERARWSAVFSLVGGGNGDYVEDGFTANGRIYRWVAPDTVNNAIVRRGDHAPVRQLVTPKRRAMLSAGARINFSENHMLSVETAFTSRDENTFSDEVTTGTGVRTEYAIRKPIRKESETRVGLRLYQEFTSVNFSEIERFRSVEFDRDWNVRGLDIGGDQHIAGAVVVLERTRALLAEAGASTFRSGADFSGVRANGLVRYNEKERRIDWRGSYTESTGLRTTEFMRQNTSIAWPVGPLLVGFKDDFEWNRFYLADTLAASSYRFHEWQTWVGSQEEKRFTWRTFYGQRTDRFPQGGLLALANDAQEYGVEGGYRTEKNARFKWNIRRRTLNIVDSTLTSDRPEETLLGRLEAGGDLFKGLFNGQLFYETGSGLEQARQFIYIEVPAGQGTHIWVDYNGDGVKDLNEFEVAAFQYEANYIRSFVPSDQYVRTYTNQFSSNIQFQPARRWSNAQGFKRFVARFSDVASARLDRKTTRDRGFDRLNPLESNFADTSLLSLGSTFRNTLSFNRTDPGFGLEYTVQDVKNRILLANGFEARGDAYHELRVRKRLAPKVTGIVQMRSGVRGAASDFLTGRNFNITANGTEPEVQWQPNNTFRLTVKGRYIDKVNDEDLGGETARIADFGLQARFSDPGKGLIEVQANVLDIAYDGESNNTLAFEMLESLAPGTNGTWTVTVQRSISRNLQLNVLYNGRTSPDRPVIHVGSVQLRATF